MITSSQENKNESTNTWLSSILAAKVDELLNRDKNRTYGKVPTGEQDPEKIKAKLIEDIKKNLTTPISHELKKEIWMGKNVSKLDRKIKPTSFSSKKWNNKWPHLLDTQFPPLMDTNFSGFKLDNINLSFSNCSTAADDDDALNHRNVSFKNANLSYSNFSNTHMNWADLEEANLEGACFIDAKLGNANLKKANLKNVNFQNADLSEANLTGASLQNANLSGAILTKANFDYANLEGSINIEVDQCSVKQAKFSIVPSFYLEILIWLTYALSKLKFMKFYVIDDFVLDNFPHPSVLIKYNDKWTLLREKYSSFKGSLYLLLLVVFMVPYTIKAFFLKYLSSLESNSPILTDLLQQEKSYKIWEILLGFDTNDFAYSGLIILLLLYNITRFWVTEQVSTLREREARNLVTPLASEYKTLYKVHRVLMFISLFTIGVAAYNAIQLLNTSVFLFR